MKNKCAVCDSTDGMYKVEVYVNYEKFNEYAFEYYYDKVTVEGTINDERVSMESDKYFLEPTKEELLLDDTSDLYVGGDPVHSYACKKCGFIMNFTKEIDSFEKVNKWGLFERE